MSAAPEQLALRPDGSPARIDKAFSWENPFSAHGMMHMVIPNAHAGDPYRIDTLFLYMANMAWNSSMNTAAVMEMLTDKGEDGEYVIPRIIYSDAYASEMVAYADLILPDTTYMERHDCISLLDRPISEPGAAGDAIRWPVTEPDRDVRGFQSVLIDLGARLGLPGFVDAEGKALYADYADYIVRHQRRPGVGPLMGFRGNGEDVGRGAPNPGQLDAYIANGGFFQAHVPDEAAYYKPWNAAYQDWAVAMGFYETPQPYLFSVYAEPMRRFQLAAEGHGHPQPPDAMRARLKQAMDPLPVWYPPFGDDGAGGLSAARADAAADAHVPFLGIAERLAAADHGAEFPLCADEGLGGAGLCRGRLGARDLARGRDRGAGGAYGRAEREHGLDLERHRQAQGGLGAGRRRAGGDEGLPAEPPDLASCCPRRATGCAGRIPIP